MNCSGSKIVAFPRQKTLALGLKITLRMMVILYGQTLFRGEKPLFAAGRGWIVAGKGWKSPLSGVKAMSLLKNSLSR
jgi:hypothetical protein